MERIDDFTETENVVINPSEIETRDFQFTGKNVTVTRTPKKYKITKRKKLEHEINEESRILTTNALVLGLASLGTVIAFTSVGAESLELSQRIGSLCLGFVGTVGVKESFEAVKDAMARKIKLENQYELHYGNDEKGKSL